MEIEDPIYFEDVAKMHQWFLENHDKYKSKWILFYKKSTGLQTVSYRETLDEALCFGWVDQLVKGIDSETYARRFTPRIPNRPWSRNNTERIQSLILEGKAQPSGIQVFKSRKID